MFSMGEKYSDEVIAARRHIYCLFAPFNSWPPYRPSLFYGIKLPSFSIEITGFFCQRGIKTNGALARTRFFPDFVQSLSGFSFVSGWLRDFVFTSVQRLQGFVQSARCPFRHFLKWIQSVCPVHFVASCSGFCSIWNRVLFRSPLSPAILKGGSGHRQS
jgi:hypothetical protein